MKTLFLLLILICLLCQRSWAGYPLNDISPNSVTIPQIAQTMGAGGTINADECGGFKLLTATGAVSVTLPTGIVAGCEMRLCNTSTNTITLTRSATLLTPTGANLAIAANCCILYGTDGNKWWGLSVMSCNS